jgi:hypothetical protein
MLSDKSFAGAAPDAAGPSLRSGRIASTRGAKMSGAANFIQDSLADGRTVQILSVIDEYNRGCVMCGRPRVSLRAG